MRNLTQICLLLALALQELICGAQPVIIQQPTNQVVVAGTSVGFSVAVSGTGPFTYQWQFNGNNLPAIITTVAGNGNGGFFGDGRIATNTSLFLPLGVTVDAGGNMFIADSLNNRIRKVDSNGIITTVVGNGSEGFSGDGGAATNAQLYLKNDSDWNSSSGGVAVDAMGNLFIADLNNNRIRKVDTNGIITTVAGNGSRGLFSGDGGAATNSTVWPHKIVADNHGNLFVVDFYNRIRKVDTNGIITTVAGNGSYGFTGDGGVATNATLSLPYGVAVDVVGNLFIADSQNMRVRKVDTNGIITTVAGNGSGGYSGDGVAATNVALAWPRDVSVDAYGNLFVVDTSNNLIRKVDTNGIISIVAGNRNDGYSGDGGAATNAALFYPYGLAVDAVGNLFIADSSNNRVRKVQMNSPSYTLSDVSKTDAGNYSVIITGSSGSVTSSVVTLKVFSLTVSTSMMLANGQFQFSFDTTTGMNYAVQYSTNLTQWFPLVTLGGVGMPLTVIDPNTANSQQRFYRFVVSSQ